RVEICVACGNGTNGIDQLGGTGTLEDITPGTGLEELPHIAGLAVLGQDYHVNVGAHLVEVRSGLEATPGHRDIHNHDVHMAIPNLLHQVMAIDRLAYHLQIGLGMDQHGQPFPQHHMVIGYKDPQLSHCSAPPTPQWAVPGATFQAAALAGPAVYAGEWLALA